MRSLTQNDLLGAFIQCAYEIDLPRQPADDFKERRIVIELASGLRFSLWQDHVIAPDPAQAATILAYEMAVRARPTFRPKTHPELTSPIAGLFLPYGWERSLGVQLANGWVLHDAFSMQDNGLALYEPEPNALPEFVPLTLPQS